MFQETFYPLDLGITIKRKGLQYQNSIHAQDMICIWEKKLDIFGT